MERPLAIAIVGDFDPEFEPHAATEAALGHSAAALGLEVSARWQATEPLAEGDAGGQLAADGVWIAPGSPYRSLDGALRAIRFAREEDVPLLGTCGGFQHVVIEYARNALGYEDAQHAEYDPYASELFVRELSCSLAGRLMRVQLTPGSAAAGHYGATEASERYYCDFGLDPERQSLLEEGGLRVSGVDQGGEARVVELPDREFFIATLFVPQLGSSSGSPHPLVSAFLRAAVRTGNAERQSRRRRERCESGT